jgi:GLPGLI family protein
MKKNIFIILLFAVQLFSAQNFHIKYVNTISPIANVQEDLYISDNNVVSVRDSIVNFYSNQPGNVKFNESTNNVQISPKSMPHKVLIYKKKDSEFVTVFEFLNETKYEIKDNLPSIKWDINYQSTKVIENYNCFEAKTNFRGSDIIAYFTEEIPFSTGPFKFGGLPGTILEISEKNSNFNSWIAVVVEKSTDKVNFVKHNAKKINLIDYLELVEKENDEFFFKNTKNLGSNVTVKRMKVPRQGIEKIYEWEKIIK